MTRHRNHGAIVVAAILLSLFGAETGARASLEDDQAVKVTLRRWGNRAGGASEVTGTISETLRLGGSAVVNASVGFFDERGLSQDRFCQSAMFGGSPEAHLGEDPHLWTVAFELVEAGTGRIVLDLFWARYDSEREGEAVRALEETRRVTLREEEVVVLDFLRSESYGVPSACPGSVLVDLTVELAGEGGLAETLLPYDMWLVVEKPDGETSSVHQRGVAVPGHLYPLPLPPVRMALPGMPAMEAVGYLQGDFRARRRRDGTTDVVVEGKFMWGVAPVGETPRGLGGNNVDLTIANLAPGESLKALLPDPAGVSTHETRFLGLESGVRDVPPDPDTGIARKGSATRVDLDRYFEGYSFSLVLTPGTPEE